MSKVYETEINAVAFIHGYVSSPGFKRNQALNPTERFQAKKLESILEKLPEHVMDKDGRHLFGADIEKPIEGSTGMYWLKQNADGQPITTCRVKLPEQIVTGLLWEQVFKKLLGESIPQELAERIEKWVPQFGLKDTFDQWAESVMPDEDENENENEPKAEAEAPVPQEA